MNGNEGFFYLTGIGVFIFCFAPLLYAAKAPSSKQQLETIATHIVVGKVQAVYSYKKREGISLVSGYEYDHKIAEVKSIRLRRGRFQKVSFMFATGVALGKE
jgi:hypothetical protein